MQLARETCSLLAPVASALRLSLLPQRSGSACCQARCCQARCCLSAQAQPVASALRRRLLLSKVLPSKVLPSKVLPSAGQRGAAALVLAYRATDSGLTGEIDE